MYYFSFLIIFLTGISGLYLGIVEFREYTNITRTAEKVSTLQIIKMAARSGLSSSLMFFAFMLFAGVLEREYVWSLQKVGGAVLVSSLLGVVVTLGGAYQIYTTVIFRGMLIRKYQEKDKPENHDD
jgi:cytochrome b subunit of formate dehydrogenase